MTIVCENGEKLDPWFMAGGNGAATMEKQYGSPQKVQHRSTTHVPAIPLLGIYLKE